MTPYLYTLNYFRGEQGFAEHIVAYSWQQAREHWRLEFIDAGVEVTGLTRSVPVLAILPFPPEQVVVV